MGAERGRQRYGPKDLTAMANSLVAAIRDLANMAEKSRFEEAHRVAATALETLAKMDATRVNKETKDKQSAAIQESLSKLWKSGKLGGSGSE